MHLILSGKRKEAFMPKLELIRKYLTDDGCGEFLLKIGEAEGTFKFEN